MSNRTKRDMLKRKLAQAYAGIDNSLAHIAFVSETFNEHHTDLAEGLQASAMLLIEAQKVIETFSLVCWATDKETLLRYK